MDPGVAVASREPSAATRRTVSRSRKCRGPIRRPSSLDIVSLPVSPNAMSLGTGSASTTAQRSRTQGVTGAARRRRRCLHGALLPLPRGLLSLDHSWRPEFLTSRALAAGARLTRCTLQADRSHCGGR